MEIHIIIKHSNIKYVPIYLFKKKTSICSGFPISTVDSCPLRSTRKNWSWDRSTSIWTFLQVLDPLSHISEGFKTSVSGCIKILWLLFIQVSLYFFMAGSIPNSDPTQTALLFAARGGCNRNAVDAWHGAEEVDDAVFGGMYLDWMLSITHRIHVCYIW